MESAAVSGDQPALVSRRARREAEQGPGRSTAGRRKPEKPSANQRTLQQRWLPKTAVLGTLAAATIAAPLSPPASAGDTPFALDQANVGPSTLDVVTMPGTAPATSSAVAAAPKVTRSDVTVSRTSERNPLPNCDPNAPVEGTNGRLADHSLCEIWQQGDSLRPDAAIALSSLNENFRAAFGRDLCLVATYRSLSMQYSVKASRGSYAASPGSSMHGWGLAIDLCSQETGSADVYRWLNANAPAYGWQNPSWAKRGGVGAYEPWHFEFVPGVQEKGKWYG
ncbi:M15 family metallopeptidase [Antribacter gilvus]|uniref:M15 family metallopeptidase n=1 Tax=Antribacter gilvus TaxID=2304675 RepID=UPI000F7B8A14|nr:M15 family metallopeptidase [Antribacter gilvus]